MGIGAGLVFPPCTTAIGVHFRRRRVLAVGVALTGVSVGAVAFPISERALSCIPESGFLTYIITTLSTKS